SDHPGLANAPSRPERHLSLARPRANAAALSRKRASHHRFASARISTAHVRARRDPLRLGGNRCRLLDDAVDVGGHGNGRRSHASAQDRIRLGPGRHFGSSCAAILYGMAAPFAAAVMLRYGVRTVVGTALALIVIGLALATRITAVWQLWLTWGVIIGLSTGATANVLGATIATRWFTKRRGLVIGMLGASNATGQLLFLPLAAWLSEHDGWRYG